MPYHWTTPPRAHAQEMQLWPHNSLPPKGSAAFILATFGMATLPLYGLLGTTLLWGLLPFLLIALAGLYYALRRNEADRQIVEILKITPEDMHLTRVNPKGDALDWHWQRSTDDGQTWTDVWVIRYTRR